MEEIWHMMIVHCATWTTIKFPAITSLHIVVHVLIINTGCWHAANNILFTSLKKRWAKRSACMLSVYIWLFVAYICIRFIISGWQTSSCCHFLETNNSDPWRLFFIYAWAPPPFVKRSRKEPHGARAGSTTGHWYGLCRYMWLNEVYCGKLEEAKFQAQSSFFLG